MSVDVPVLSATAERERPQRGAALEHLEPKAIDGPTKDRLRAHFDALAPRRERFRRKNRYYYDQLVKGLSFIIPPGRNVLEIGCGDGYVLSRLNPSRGVGIDLSPCMIERAREQAAAEGADHLEFHCADAEAVRFGEQFDFVILSDLLGVLLDIEQVLLNVRSACGPHTRVVIHYHSMLWEPLMGVVARLGQKMPQPHHNWLTRADIDNFLNLADFELVRFERRMLLPKRVPLLSRLVNGYLAPLPGLNALCLTNLLVIRMRERRPERALSSTILIPCRNERGNIRDAIVRLPAFGSEQEIIFVDGHSTDGTVEEIQRVIAEFPGKDIKLLHQSGKGKGDAVRLGFARASKDVLMILDADLTMPPEDLPKFHRALAGGKGEFINGSRLVYPMEKEAMRFLNILGNKFFSVVLSWLLNQRLKDTLCGTKVLLRRDYEKIVAGRSHFGDFDPFGDFDLLFGAAKQNLRIVEVPIRYRDRTYGTTNISRFRHGWLLLRMSAFAFRKLKVG